MSGFLENFQNLFAPKANPIGVDFGSDSLRLAQVQWSGTEFRLVAAGSADVPSQVRRNAAARFEFFVDTVRDLLAQSDFRGRQAILSLPSSAMIVQHLRLPKMEDAELRKALQWEARGKLPFDPSNAVLRHLLAGDVFQHKNPKSEVILMAAPRQFVQQYLAAASRAHLDVFGMNVEPKAIVDCFTQIYKRKADQHVTSCYVDFGYQSTRAVIAHDGEIHFARSIAIGGEHLNIATAAALGISPDDAKLMRIKIAHAQYEIGLKPERLKTARGETAESNLSSPLAAGTGTDRRRQLGAMDAPEDTPASATSPAMLVERATRDTLNKLAAELELCRRYHDATFPKRPVDRIIFIGGEARHQSMCQYIARELGVQAQVGDPMARLGRTSEIGAESGINPREPQPGWVVAIGLSMGPNRAALAANVARSA